MRETQNRVSDLRLKLGVRLAIFVTIMILVVSVPLGVLLIRQKTQSLAEDLQNRTRLLVGTIAERAEAEIRKGIANGGDIGIGALTSMDGLMDGARFITITGPADALRLPGASACDFVWASDSEAWKKRKAAGTFQVAMEQEKDALSGSVVPELQDRINAAASRTAAAELEDWQKARDRFRELDARRSRTAAEQAESVALLRDLPTKVAAIDSALKTLPQNAVYSQPRFDPPRPLAPEYLFYKPIVYFAPGDTSFFHGLVRLGVDTAATRRQIMDSARSLIGRTALIALAAIALGIVGAFIIANTAVSRIQGLGRGERAPAGAGKARKPSARRNPAAAKEQ